MSEIRSRRYHSYYNIIKFKLFDLLCYELGSRPLSFSKDFCLYLFQRMHLINKIIF